MFGLAKESGQKKIFNHVSTHVVELIFFNINLRPIRLRPAEIIVVLEDANHRSNGRPTAFLGLGWPTKELKAIRAKTSGQGGQQKEMIVQMT